MGTYSIKDLEKLSGVKAHTIRIWEQRYSLLEPNRSDSNIRSYDDTQLKKLLRANVLYKAGTKISKIAELSEYGLTDEINKILKVNSRTDAAIEVLTISMIEMDESKFDEILNDQLELLGFENLMEQIIYPFLDRIGVLWVTNVISPAQEHFMSNLIRQKIIAAIDNLPLNLEPKSVCISFLHEEEMHELGLLYYSYLLKKAGVKVIYLGQMVPIEDLCRAANIHKPDFLLTAFVSAVEEEWVNEYVQSVLNLFEDTTLLSAGINSSLIKINSDRLKVLSNSKELQASL